MKNIISLFLASLFTVVSLSSCSVDFAKSSSAGETAAVVSESNTSKTSNSQSSDYNKKNDNNTSSSKANSTLNTTSKANNTSSRKNTENSSNGKFENGISSSYRYDYSSDYDFGFNYGSSDLDYSNSSEVSSAVSSVPAPPQAKTLNIYSNSNFSDLYLGSDLEYGVTIKGNAQSNLLTLPGEISLKGDLTLSNLTLKGSNTVIYANGYKLKIDSNVKASAREDRLTVYGGSKSETVSSTDLELLGGSYKAVFGGGNQRSVTNNTNVVFGGNANIGETNDDSSSLVTPCYVYGGGNNAAVLGTTNIEIAGNAVVRMVSGVGSGTGGAGVKNANINISGGKIMNVFGGSLNANVSSLNVTITMTGGLAEAIFGGCQGKSMTGNAHIRLLGGDVSRRVYTGCYNDCDVGFFSDTWKSSCHIKGTTKLTIGPNAKLATGTGLSSDNKPDMGIFCGSRYKSGFSDEVNTLVFIEGCYNSKKDYIGPSKNSYWDLCESHHDNIIKQ